MLRSTSSLLLGLCVLAALGACGDSDDGGGGAGVNFFPIATGGTMTAGTGAGTGGTMAAGTGGTMAAGTGGTAAPTGGTGVTGGTMALVNPDDVYTCEPPPPEPGGSATAGMPCCGGLGTCMAGVTGPGTAAYGLDDCMAGADLKCAPAIGTGGDAGTASGMDASVAAIPASCRVSISGFGPGGGGGGDAGPGDAGAGDAGTEAQTFEGRCIPQCFVANDPAASNLVQESCATGELCVPCYSPITAESTGACEQNGDAPVEDAPAGGFTECGGDPDAGTSHGGYCVPGSIASGQGGGALMQLNCAADEVCAPKLLVADPTACFPRCMSLGGTLPGACTAAFLVPAEFHDLLGVDTCAEGDICSPCIDIRDGQPTGACN